MKPRAPSNRNLNQKQAESLKQLKQNPHIIIKKADKGSAVTVMNTLDYIREGYRQLSNSNYYIELDTDPTPTFNQLVQTLIDQMLREDFIDDRVHRSLTNKDPKTPNFYLLPKIHKNGVPGRPILSANGCPTEKLSALVDCYLQPHVPKLASYVRDTKQFIQKIENIQNIPPNSLLVSFDVVSLYTNIPHADSLRSASKALRGDTSIEPQFKNLLIRGLKLVLELNAFQFNGRFFQQIRGTAMGTRVAPSSACLTMGDLEDTFLTTAINKPTLWLRYIDDIFCIWPHSLSQLDEFHQHINSAHPTLKFTYEVSPTSLSFLDTVITLNEGSLSSELYTKPTDTHNYLHYTSCHPINVKKGLPFGQFLRINRNCTQPEKYTKHRDNLKGYLTNRGYPNKLVDTAALKCSNIARNTLLMDTPKTRSPNRTPVVLTFHPTNPPVIQLIHKYWPLLEGAKHPDLYASKPITAYRRLPNIKDQIVRAQISYPPTNKGTQGHTLLNYREKCQNSKCTICPLIQKGNRFTSHYTKRSYTLKKVLLDQDCMMYNIIYLITCTKCKKQYVGETKRTLLIRTKEHLADIKHNRDTPVAKHFNTEGHSHNHLNTLIIEYFNLDLNIDNTTRIRRSRESFWIYQLRTLKPLGLNDHA